MRPCSQCSTTNPDNAIFCGACGAPFDRSPAIPPSPPMPASPAAANVREPLICAGCGVLVDVTRRSCATCDTPRVDPPLRAANQPGGGYWVGVRATFTCSACAFDVPLNHFALGDGVVCTRCGLEQRYDESHWRELVSFAHGVGDLGTLGSEGRFPDPARPLGRRNPFADLGARASWVEQERVRASPGNPLCAACKSPRVVVGKTAGRIEVGCSRCAERHTYEIPPRPRALVPELAGVLADEHEADKREVVIAAERGVSVLRCPNCSAPLSGVKDGDGVIHCGYCKVACTISTHAHARVGHKDTPVKTWWLYFDRPSARRETILRAQQAEAEVARREEEERARETAERRRRDRESEAIQQAAEAKAKAVERRAALPLVLSLFVFGPIVGGAIYFSSFKKHEAQAASRPSADVLSRYSFAMTPAQAGALFGAPAGPGAQVKLDESGVFKEVHLGLGGDRYGLDLFGGAAFDAAKTHARLAEIAPNRLVVDVNGNDEIATGKILLRVDRRKTAQYTSHVQVLTYLSGEPGVKSGDALLAAVRYAAMDQAKPSPEQLLVLNGPPLSNAKTIAATTTTAEATKAFTTALPTGACKTSSSLDGKTTRLACEADVDDGVVSSVQYSWPSLADGRLQRISFRLTKRGGKKPIAAPPACITSALGPGERKVVDFATQASEVSWPYGKGGDRARFDGQTLDLVTRDGAGPDLVPDWADAYPKIVDALASCAR